MTLDRGSRVGLALVLLAGALAPAALGGYLVSKGPSPLPEVRPASVTGRVVRIESRASTSRHKGTLYRTVVEYAAAGKLLEAASRSVYRSARHRVGDDVTVLLLDGDVWLAFEWEAERASEQLDRSKQRWTNRLLGGLLLGCAAFTLLLSVGVLRARPA
jgi:hypothetical protein